MMTDGFASLGPQRKAREALAHVRKVHTRVETLADLYVLDPDGKLVGVVLLRDVLVAPPGRRIERLMNRRLVTVAHQTDREEVARPNSLYDYLALPVVSPDGKMLGMIPVWMMSSTSS
jgi:magnesium transporter